MSNLFEIQGCQIYFFVFYYILMSCELFEQSFQTFLLLHNIGHPVKMLSTVIEMLFHSRHSFEIECQLDKNE